MRAMRAGDSRAFRMLYHRHSRYVAGTVFRLLGSDQELDDIVQDTFWDAFRNLEQLRRPERLRSWLAAIAVRQVQRRLRLRGRRRRIRGQVARQQQADRAGDVSKDQELATALYAALDELSPELRTPWVLHRVMQHTLPEVAELCQMSLATVKRRIARAQERLRRRLDNG